MCLEIQTYFLLLLNRDDFNVHVLAEFSKLFDFNGLDFDIALRRFLYSFRLPGMVIPPPPLFFSRPSRLPLLTDMIKGEAQKIDRIMNAFAMQYYANNPADVFKNSGNNYMR